VSAETAMPGGAPTLDAFLGGRVALIQPPSGHRAGLDAALLQALVPAASSGHAIDLGAGVGTAGFAAAARAPALSVVGIERDPDLVALGDAALQRPENAAFAARVRLLCGDAADGPALREAIGLGARGVDWVLMNPPFNAVERMRPSPHAARRAAHLAADGLIAAWCATAALLLKHGGRLGLIHRAAALPEVLAALSGRFGDIRLLPVRAAAGDAAIRIVIRARRGRRTPLALLPGLTLHQPDGSWTGEAEAILRGEAELAM